MNKIEKRINAVYTISIGITCFLLPCLVWIFALQWPGMENNEKAALFLLSISIVFCLGGLGLILKSIEIIEYKKNLSHALFITTGIIMELIAGILLAFSGFVSAEHLKDIQLLPTFFGLLMLLLGHAIFTAGCGVFAIKKKWSVWMAWLGAIFGLAGLIVLILFERKE